MYVVVREETEGVLVHVMGEKLALGKDGAFLLPGRLIHALKPEDLPEGSPFLSKIRFHAGQGFIRKIM